MGVSDFKSSDALFFRGLVVELALGRRVVVVGDADARALLRVAVVGGVVVVAGVVVAVRLLAVVGPIVASVVTDDAGVAVPDGPGPPLAEQALRTTMVDARTADLRSASFTTSPSCHNSDRTVRP